MPIPWKQSRPSLPNNMYGAMCRLNGPKKRLDKTGMTERYDENISTMVEKGYAERVPSDELRDDRQLTMDRCGISHTTRC